MQCMPALQNGPLALLHAPQMSTSFGAGKHTNPPPELRSHASPAIASQPSFVTGLHDGCAQSIAQESFRHWSSVVSCPLLMHVLGSAFIGSKTHVLQSASAWQSSSSLQQEFSTQV